MLSIRAIHPFDAAVEEAEQCRAEARTTVEKNPGNHAELKSQPSGWCVVTQKGIWSRAYHNVYGAEQLKEVLDRGHKVLLTVGLVARPDAPISPKTHVAAIRVADSSRLSELKLDLVCARAKLHAARALLS